MDRRKTDRRNNETKDPYSFDLNELLATILRRKVLIAVLSLLVFIPGLFYIATKPPMYRAISTILLEETDYGLADLQDAMGASRIDDAAFETQLSILKSPKLIQQTLSAIYEGRAITQGDIMGFYRNLGVESSGRSRVLAVSYRSPNPDETAELVNTHVKNFIDYRIEMKRQQVDVINEWLNEQLEKLKQDSQKKGQAIKEFRGESGITLGPDATNIIYEQISELTRQLVPIETRKIALQSKVEALEAGQASTLSDISQSPLIEQLKTQLSTARQELRATSAKFGPSHPDRRAAEKRVAQLQAEISGEIVTIRKSIINELSSVTKQEELLNSRIDELNRQADLTQNQSITMEGLQGELEANRKILIAYMDKFQEVKTRLDLNRSDVRILDTAAIPAAPSGPGKSVMAVLLIMLSVLFGICTTLILEFVDRGIEREEDVKNALNLRLMGILPHSKNPLGALSSKTRNAYTEELKRIYLLLAARSGAQTILVTSAAKGEGKTTTALGMGRYLASIGARVVLVDADTIKPSVASLTGTDVVPGYAELIAGGTDLTKSIQHDKTGLAIISSGDQDAHPVDILSSNALVKSLDALKAQYDYVILDCADVLSSTDAEVIAGKTDIVIMVVEWEKIAKKKLKIVAETLRQHARDVPHVIINKRR